MKEKEIDKESLILKSAEEEFLEKGYTNAKTTEIAKRAGVTHAMLHYYYRTKRNLFEIVLQRKMESLVNVFVFSFKQDLPFLEKLKKGVEDHFDVVSANPKLPNFIFSEILNNEENRNYFLNILKPHFLEILQSIEIELRQEANQGNVKYIEPYNLLFAIISVNVFGVLALPVITGLLEMNANQFEAFKLERKKQNVELVMSLLRV